MAGIDLALQISLLLLVGVVCQWSAWRLQLPAILPLLLVGLVLGPATGLLNPDEVLGDLLFPFVSIGVAIILFEGSLTLRLSDARNVQRIIRNLTTVGVLVTWGVMAAAAHYLAGLSWSLSLLFGALVAVTGPTVIVPMLRSIQTTARVANILRWEGILVDPIGAVLAVLIFEFLVTGHEGESFMEFIKVVVIGSVWGIAGGVILGFLLRRHFFPHYLQNFAVLAIVLMVFTLSNHMGHESGLIAVTVMGIVLANFRDLDVSDLLSFKENLTVVLISVFFILLAARLDIALVMQMLVPALLVLGVAVLIARPLSVWISAIGTSVNAREGWLLSWVAPRGIVAAAVSSLFAIKLAERGVPGAESIVPLTFVLIIGTVVIQSLSAGWVAARLGLSSRGEQGVLISNANSVSIALGVALKANGFKVKICDLRRDRLMEARMKELEVFYGNPLSEHADHYMDLTGFTHMLALSQSAETNAMVCNHYRHEFGPSHTFALSDADGKDRRSRLAMSLQANVLFAEGVSWAKLASLLAKGGEIRSTRLTEEYDFEAHSQKWGKQSLPLFAVTDKGRLRVFNEAHPPAPGPGWVLINLVNNEQS